MSEPKDPAIKLFGKTIPLPEKSPKAAATTNFCATCGDDNNSNNNLDQDKDQDRCCSTNSSPEVNTGEEGEAEKVRIIFFWILFGNFEEYPLFRIWK